MENENMKPIMLAQANALTQARYDFNPVEKRCLYQIIREVRRLFVDSNIGQKDLFNNMRVKLSPKMLSECRDSKHVKEVYESLKRLRKRDVEIDNENMWMNTGFVTMVKHDKRANMYEVEVSSEIMPCLVALAEKFTVYDLTVAISLKSGYSQRFYEFCCQYRNRVNKTFFLSVQELREKMILENKYPNAADFKRFVIDVAQKELKEAYNKGQCDLWFDYQVKETQGKKILSWFFYVHTKEEEATTDYQSVTECIRQIDNILRTFFPRDKDFIRRVTTAVTLRPDIAFDLTEKLQKKVNDYKRSDIPPIIRYVLREDFNIE